MVRYPHTYDVACRFELAHWHPSTARPPGYLVAANTQTTSLRPRTMCVLFRAGTRWLCRIKDTFVYSTRQHCAPSCTHHQPSTRNPAPYPNVLYMPYS